MCHAGLLGNCGSVTNDKRTILENHSFRIKWMWLCLLATRIYLGALGLHVYLQRFCIEGFHLHNSARLHQKQSQKLGIWCRRHQQGSATRKLAQPHDLKEQQNNARQLDQLVELIEDHMAIGQLGY